MREVLFRGKKIKDGEWVYGDLITSKDKYYIHPTANSFQVSDSDLSKLIVLHEVFPDTIGQFTGLTDKNGKKIFENDIVKLTDTHYQTEWYANVEFGNPYCQYSWGYEFVYIKGDKVNTDCLLWVDMEEMGVYCEVIGNNDNPELLGD